MIADRLFDLFNDELETLRDLGARFAAQYPKLAGRLRLAPDTIDDPHVARLVESFAFVAARLRLKLDDDFPELTETLLEFLYPHYLAPIPSLSVAAIEPAHDLTGATTIPRGTLVESEPLDGDICRFRTTQDVELWPVRVVSVSQSGQPVVAPPAPRLDAAACLRLVLECSDPTATFTELGVDRLRFYLRAPWRQALAVYELLLNDCIGIAFADHPEDDSAVFVGSDAIRAVGFDEAEAALPLAPRSHPAFRLVTEFFAYPERFLFVDLTRISAKGLRQAGHRLEVFFYLRRYVPDLDRALSPELFALGCTPIVNLFEQRAEPIVLSRAVSEYAVVPDARRHATREVYSIDEVSVVDGRGSSRIAAPMFGRPVDGADGPHLHWQLRRRHLIDRDQGTDARLAIVDAAAGPHSATDSVLTIETTCLNRDLAGRLPYGGGHPALHMARNTGEIGRLHLLLPFTPTARLAPDQGLLWRLLSHLKLGHLSLVDDTNGPEPFREMMRLYDFRETPEMAVLIEAISQVRSRRSTARIAGGLARGLDIELEIDPRGIEPGLAFMFGQVLDRFFGLYVNLNSFTRLTLRLKGASRPVKTWAARSGEKALA